VEIRIKDSCASSIINSNSALSVESTLAVPLGLGYKSMALSGPSDSASIVYGNGFDVCGKRKYSLLNASTRTPVDLENLIIKVNA
jgi:hypothetical protein